MKVFALIDMDAFFTSVEEVINPRLKFKPVVVGSRVVACANYVARKYQIHSAMPTFKAKQLCPQLIILNGQHQKYIQVSKKLKSFFTKFSPYVYQASIDEFYLDLSTICKNFEEAEIMAFEFSNSIKKYFKITASIGIGSSLIIAKIASEVNKPNGIKIVYPEDSKNFILNTKVEKFPGVGKSTLKKLKILNIRYANGIFNTPIESTKSLFTKDQIDYLKLLFTGDDRASFILKERKNSSISRSSTFSKPIFKREELLEITMYFLESILRSMRKKHLLTNVADLSLRDMNYKWHSKRKTLNTYTRSQDLLYKVFESILDKFDIKRPVKGLRIKVENLKEENTLPLSIFDDKNKLDMVYKKILPLEEKYNKRLLQTGLSYYYSKMFKE